MTRDEGRMWVRRDYGPVFDRIGWRTCHDVMSSPRPTLVRRIASRANCVADLPSPGGGQVHVYLKRHFSERLRRPSFAHSPGVAGVTSGVYEADAVGACQRAGVATMQVVAAGQQPSDRPHRADSFFISEDLAGALPAEACWPRLMEAAAEDAADLLRRRAEALAAMADAAAALHEHGLFHRDLYWCHFMIGPAAAQVRLIDLQRLYRPRITSAYARMKDLAQFVVSAPPTPTGPTAAEMQGWYARYRRVHALSSRERLSLTVIRTRAMFYRIKGMKA